eukprot:744621_1
MAKRNSKKKKSNKTTVLAKRLLGLTSLGFTGLHIALRKGAEETDGCYFAFYPQKKAQQHKKKQADRKALKNLMVGEQIQHLLRDEINIPYQLSFDMLQSLDNTPAHLKGMESYGAAIKRFIKKYNDLINSFGLQSSHYNTTHDSHSTHPTRNSYPPFTGQYNHEPQQNASQLIYMEKIAEMQRQLESEQKLRKEAQQDALRLDAAKR